MTSYFISLCCVRSSSSFWSRLLDLAGSNHAYPMIPIQHSQDRGSVASSHVCMRGPRERDHSFPCSCPGETAIGVFLVSASVVNVSRCDIWLCCQAVDSNVQMLHDKRRRQCSATLMTFYSSSPFGVEQSAPTACPPSQELCMA